MWCGNQVCHATALRSALPCALVPGASLCDVTAKVRLLHDGHGQRQGTLEGEDLPGIAALLQSGALTSRRA